MKNRNITAYFFVVLLFLFILSFSIALPIYLRPFYYWQINALSLTDTGFTAEEIKTAYNAVLDYLTLPCREFSCGIMEYSAEGAAHFADCKTLFNLNLTVLLISGFSVFLLTLLQKTGKISKLLIHGRSASFYSGVLAIIFPLIIGGFAAIDFEFAFTVFHLIFFPGKTNWGFNPELDEIINVLPEQFFMNCATLIGVSILILSAICIVLGIKERKNEK